MAGFAGYSLGGSRWPGTTITYSFATSATATSPGGAFSGYQGAPPPLTSDASFDLYFATQRVLQAWTGATGIFFQQVPDSTRPDSLPDIRIGYGVLSGGALSVFSAVSVNGVFQPGAELLAEDPRATPLVTNGVYQGASIGLYDVIESAVGHALGLATDTGPSVSSFFSKTNALNITDGTTSTAFINTAGVAGVEALYGPLLQRSAAYSISLTGEVVGLDSTGRQAFPANVVKTVYTSLPTGTLVSLTSDGAVQVQANQPGSAVITAPGARLLGVLLRDNRSISVQGLSDPTGNTERVARLYRAELGRTSDLAGLYRNADQVDQGAQSLIGVANNLASSPEFVQAHPAASGGDTFANAVFVDTLYRNMFGRPIDPEGAGYVTALQNGTSRGEVANSIAQSLEARLDYLPYEGDRSLGMIYRSYEAAFGRAPDSAGVATYVPLPDAGLSAQDFTSALIGGSEFAATSGAGSVAYFVTQTYQNALGRGPDASGLASYAGLIASGTSRAQVFADIANSNEARAHSALATHDGWVSL